MGKVGSVGDQLKLLVTLFITAGRSKGPLRRSKSDEETNGMGKVGLIGM